MGLNRRIIPSVVASTADPINDPFGDGSQYAYYPFNNSVTDVQNNYTPPWNGTPCFNLNGVDGTSNGAISADGTNSSSGSGDTFVKTGVLPISGSSISSNPFAISFHFKVRDCGDSGSNIFSDDVFHFEYGVGLYITVNSGYIGARINDNGTTRLAGYATQLSYSWAHIVVQVTSSKVLQVYVNSSLSGSASISNSTYVQTGSKEYIFLTTIENPISNTDQGTVDNLRIFRKALSTSEISYLDTNLL